MKDKREFLYNDEEIEKMDQDENLKKAIGLLMALDRSFSDNMAEFDDLSLYYKSIINNHPDFDAPDLTDYLTNALKEYRQSKSKALGRKFPQKLDNEYYSAETLFKKQCEKERKSDPTFDIEVFAECEKKHIEGIIEQVEQLTYKSYYAKHPTYAQGKEYIKYLSKVSNGQIIEPIQGKTEKTFSTGYSPEQLKKLRKALIDSCFIFNSISEADFIYIFTGQPITNKLRPIKWQFSRGINIAVRDFITELIPGEPVHIPQVTKCFIDKKGMPVKINKPKENEHSKYCKKLVDIIESLKQ